MKIMKTIGKIALLFLMVLNASFSFAQGCCSGGAPLSGNLDLASTEAGSFSLRAIYDYNNLGSVVVGNKLLNDDTRTRLTKTGLIRLEYGLTKRWAFSGLFTFVRQAEKISFNNISNNVFGQGIGDIVLMSQFNILNNVDRKASIGGGIKFPTGSIGEFNETLDLLLPPDLQPGTGAWDFIAVAQFLENNVFFENLNLSAGTTYRITTAAPRFDQQQQYKFGNILQSFVGFNRPIYLDKALITPQITARYRYAFHDQTNGFKTTNTGGHWVYLIGGVETFFNKKFGISLTAEVPVYWNLEGVQLTTTYKLIGGVVFNFYKKEELEFEKVF